MKRKARSIGITPSVPVRGHPPCGRVVDRPRERKAAGPRWRRPSSDVQDLEPWACATPSPPSPPARHPEPGHRRAPIRGPHLAPRPVPRRVCVTPRICRRGRCTVSGAKSQGKGGEIAWLRDGAAPRAVAPALHYTAKGNRYLPGRAGFSGPVGHAATGSDFRHSPVSRLTRDRSGTAAGIPKASTGCVWSADWS